MTMKIGDRIGAVKMSTTDTIYMYGWGTYIGDRIPTEGEVREDPTLRPYREIGIPSPCFRLDDNRGDIYSFECFFQREEYVRNEIVRDRGVEFVALRRRNR